MPTFGDLERRLSHVRTLLEGPSVERGLASLSGGERQEFLGLSHRVIEACAELAAAFVIDEIEELDESSSMLFALLGNLSLDLLRAEAAPSWTKALQELAGAMGRMVQDTPAQPSIERGSIPGAPMSPLAKRGSRRGVRSRGVRGGREGATFSIPGEVKEEAPPSAPPPRARPARYANAALFEEAGDRRLSSRSPLAPGQVFRLRLDIGELSRESQVERPAPFPDHALPDADVWIDVMVSSTHFELGADRRSLGRERAVHGRFFLPRDGGPASTPEGGPFLDFLLEAPREPRGGARARVGYYFRGAVIQSQVLIADVGTGRGFRIATDFTVAEDPSDLGAIRERPRISLFANDNGDGSHQIAVRVRGDGAGAPAGTSFEARQQVIGTLVDKMRRTLRDNAPTERKRPRARLIADLRALAPVGRDLWTASAGQFLHVLNVANQDLERSVLQVARSTTSSFAFPWTLLYHFPLDSDIPPERLAVCPLVERWDGRTPLFEGAPRQCPESGRVPHQNILCPFGFWGFRYSLEQIVATDKPVTAIEVPDAPRVVVAETKADVDPRRLADHVARLRAILTAAFPNLDLREGKDKATIHELLGTDLPLVYFFCHGQKVNLADPNTFLGVGDREKITAGDLIGWVQTWLEQDNLLIWDRVRPLVFINACHSVEINPDTLVSYLAAFVGTARAAGVIGTEVKVQQDLAMEFAQSFFERFVRDRWTVDRALHDVRLDFLRDGNLFGLLYTPYCWADLALRPAGASRGVAPTDP